MISKRRGSLSDCNSLTSLTIYSYKLSDLSGLTSLSTLKTLVCQYNQLSNIDDISSLTQLTSVNLSNNSIRNLKPLETLTKMTSLNLKNNCIYDSGSYEDEDGNTVTYKNLQILANLNYNNGTGSLKSLWLSGNDGITDYSLISGLSWSNKDF